MNILNFAKVFALSIVLIIFSFLINNYLTFGGNWPGAFSINKSLNFLSIIQFSLYLFAIIFPIFFFNFYNKELSIIKLADYFENTNGFIIRFAFWSVLIIGIIDALISLLIIEGFIEYFFGKSRQAFLCMQGSCLQYCPAYTSICCTVQIVANVLQQKSFDKLITPLTQFGFVLIYTFFDK